MNVTTIDTVLIDRNAIFPVSADDSQTVPQEEPDAIAPETETSDQIAGDDTETSEISTNDAPKVKGVIRRLQEGHFKGVADVRLRINFNDEIMALEQGEAARVAEEGVSALIELVDSEITSLLETEGLDEQAIAAVNEAKNAFMTGIPATTGDPISGLRSSFEDLTSSLNTALGVAEEPSVEEPINNPDPVIEPEDISLKAPSPTADGQPETVGSTSFDFGQFITNLVESFSMQLQELETALAEIRVLPEISEPQGKGVAYDKFMAIYNQIRTPESEAPIDEVL
jgi:hypothetical protein